MPEQAATVRICQGHSTETVAIDAGNAVMPGQPFIRKCIVGIQQVKSAPVLTHDAGKKQFRLAAECLPQVIVEVRKQQEVRFHLLKIAKLQPLPGEV